MNQYWKGRALSAGRLFAAVALSVAMAVGAARPAEANVRLEVPEESPGGPFYARLSAGGVLHDDQWAVIVFYRDPSCVPDDLNLVQFFDFPRAFGCPLTVQGFEIWRNGPGQDQAPIHSSLSGSDVPVWLVSWPELQAAMADAVLTMAELEGLPSLRQGVATRFHEILHPSVGDECRCHIEINAAGNLAGGKSFTLHAVHSGEPEDDPQHVEIRLG